MTYAPSGAIKVTVVDGTTRTGLIAPDGSTYVVIAPDPAVKPIGFYHPCGAMNVTVAPNGIVGRYAPDGSTYVTTTKGSPSGALFVDGLEVPVIPVPMEEISNLYGVYGTRTILPSYAGPLISIQRDTDAAIQDFSAGPDGWVSETEVSAFLGANPGFIVNIYDQTGDGTSLAPTATNRRPEIQFINSRPTVSMNTDYLSFNGKLGFARNVGDVCVGAVRRYSNTIGTRVLFYASAGVNAAARLQLLTGSGPFRINSRRLDNDTGATSTGHSASTAWQVELARMSYANAEAKHHLDDVMITSPMGTPGNTADTDSQEVVTGGLSGGGVGIFVGSITAWYLIKGSLTDDEARGLVQHLQDLKP